MGWTSRRPFVSSPRSARVRVSMTRRASPAARRLAARHTRRRGCCPGSLRLQSQKKQRKQNSSLPERRALCMRQRQGEGAQTHKGGQRPSRRLRGEVRLPSARRARAEKAATEDPLGAPAFFLAARAAALLGSFLPQARLASPDSGRRFSLERRDLCWFAEIFLSRNTTPLQRNQLQRGGAAGTTRRAARTREERSLLRRPLLSNTQAAASSLSASLVFGNSLGHRGRLAEEKGVLTV